MYKSVRYSNMPAPVRQRQETQPRQDTRAETSKRDVETKAKEIAKNNDNEMCENQRGLFDNLESDDIVLLIVAFALLMDGCDDKMLLAALAFIFLSDNC